MIQDKIFNKLVHYYKSDNQFYNFCSFYFQGSISRIELGNKICDQYADIGGIFCSLSDQFFFGAKDCKHSSQKISSNKYYLAGIKAEMERKNGK